MKKILSIALCIMMLMGALTSLAEDTAVTAETEAVNPKHQEAIEFLIDMGLFSDSEIHANEPATRGALAEMAVLATGVENQPAMDTPFDDVKSDDPRSGYINVAWQNGLMKGYSDGIFDPNGCISSEQLTIVLTRMTGHSAFAELEGGTTAAYANAARKAGLLKGVSFKNPASVTYGELAYAIRKALDVKILKMIGVSVDDSIFDASTENTLLNSALNMTKIEGQVTANYFTGLVSSSNLKENQVEISGNVYTTTIKDIADYLGWRVSAYIDSEDVVRAVEKVRFEDSEISIESNEIESIESGEITYRDEKGKIYTLEYRTNGYLIYNGEAKFAWEPADIQGVNNGEIRLLDSDNDGVYDIIFADQYTDLIVNSISANNETVYFKSGSRPAYVDLSKNGNLKYELKDTDGNIIEFTDIAKNDLVSLAMSSSNKVCKIVVSKEIVAGICSEVSADYVTINGTEYRLSGALKNTDTVKLNSEGTFYINYLGNVAVYERGVVYNYGYLKSVGYTQGIETEMAFELLTTEGKIEVYYLADKVEMNEAATRVTPSDLVGNSLLFDGEGTKEQLISYNLNSEGKINRFSTAADGSDMSYAEKENVFSRDAILGSDVLDTRYLGGSWKMFGGRYRLDDNTKIFVIPSDVEDEDKYRVINHTGLVNESYYKNVQIFDENENNVVKAIVIPADGESSIDQYSPVAVVKAYKKVLNEDGGYDDCIVVVNGGNEIALTAEKDEPIARMNKTITDRDRDNAYVVVDSEVQKIALSKLDVGDVICYQADADGSLNDIEVIFRADFPIGKESWFEDREDVEHSPKPNYYYRMRYAAYGTVDAVIENGVRAKVTGIVNDDTGNTVPIENTRVFPTSASTTLLGMNERGEISAIQMGDIASGDMFFIYSGSSGVKLIIVYR